MANIPKKTSKISKSTLPKAQDMPNQKPETPMIVELQSEEISKRAYNLFKMNKTWNEYVTELATMDTQLRPAIIFESCPPEVETTLTPLDKIVKMDPHCVQQQPSKDMVNRMIKSINNQQMKMQDVHWFLAERQILMEKVLDLKQRNDILL